MLNSSNIEEEVWGVLTAKGFKNKLKELSDKLGSPKKQNRLSIQVLDLDDKSLWTRIRITEGKAAIMQKVADWNADARKEIKVEISPDADIIYRHFLILKNLIGEKRLQTVIMQHENYIFSTKEYEIKLSKQKGKIDKYPFEIESLDPGVDLLAVADEYGLEPDISDKGEDFWNKWNAEVNLDASKMEEEEIKGIISEYL